MWCNEADAICICSIISLVRYVTHFTFTCKFQLEAAIEVALVNMIVQEKIQHEVFSIKSQLLTG